METFAILAGVFVTAGTVFAAIFAARAGAEKTLKEHIERLEEDIKNLNGKIKTMEDENRKLRRLYENEKKRSDELERKLIALTRKRRK